MSGADRTAAAAAGKLCRDTVVHSSSTVDSDLVVYVASRVQVELFLGPQLVDDSLSLVDVAYIYIRKKVKNIMVVFIVYN